jgi:hypothetical protein
LVIASSFEREPLYQLWHTIYSIKDLDECKSALMKRFSFDEELLISYLELILINKPLVINQPKQFAKYFLI